MKARVWAKRSLRAKSREPLQRLNTGCKKSCSSATVDAKRDWGNAPEYVEGIWRILQLGEGDDFVLATREAADPR